MISLTSNAISHLRSITQDREVGAGLRLAVEKGGCAGMQYIMKIDLRESMDYLVEKEGITVMVDPDSLEFIKGSTLDYQDDLNDSGFRILNPRASRSCGCGTSFEPENQV
jgi:iron-sulfur cluster assembly accessory protein